MADKPADDERISSDPLQPWENKAVRKMLRDEERVQWLWATVRLWCYYIGGAVTGIYLFQDYMSKMFKKVLSWLS